MAMLVPLRPTRAEIDLGAIVENYLAIRRRVGVEVMGIVKADAYGHGAVPVARILARLGAPMFGVAILQEAIQLREAGITQPILVLGCLLAGEIEPVIEYGLHVQISDLRFARELSERAARAGRCVGAHLKIDTGMGRSGVLPGGAAAAAVELAAMPGLSLQGLMTHFPSSDEADGVDFTRAQIESFARVAAEVAARGIQVPLRHAANSGAVLGHPEGWLNMVRPGMILYGCYPAPGVDRALPLRQAMALKTRVVLVRDVPKGHTISYGRTYTTPHDMRLALLPIGYDDGLDRRLSNRGRVLIRAARLPIVGRVCMDQCLVDATSRPDVQVGDEAVIYGRQGDECILIEDVAADLGTIPNVLVCAVSRRVPRVYRNAPDLG